MLQLQLQQGAGCWIHTVQNLFGGVDFFTAFSVEFFTIIPLRGCVLTNDRGETKSEINVNENALLKTRYNTYKVEVAKSGMTGLASMVNGIGGSYLASGLGDIDLCHLLNAMNDPLTAKGIYLGKRILAPDVYTMSQVVDTLRNHYLSANAAILYYGYQTEDAVNGYHAYGHYVTLWYYDGEGNVAKENWCYYDSYDKRVFFGKTLMDLDEKLAEKGKRPLYNDNKFIHAFALPKFGPSRTAALNNAVTNVTNKVQECWTFYQLRPLVDLAARASNTVAMPGI